LALHFAAMLHQIRGDQALSEHFAQEALALATAEGFLFWEAGARVLRGWAWSQQGAGEIAIAEMQRGIDAWLATGSGTYQSYYLGLLASALLHQGKIAAALAAVDEALGAVGTLDEHLYEAPLWQLKAEARGQRTNDEQMQSCTLKALAVATAQQAVYFHRKISASKSTMGMKQRSHRVGV
jgi:predicted ATPase